MELIGYKPEYPGSVKRTATIQSPPSSDSWNYSETTSLGNLPGCASQRNEELLLSCFDGKNSKVSWSLK